MLSEFTKEKGFISILDNLKRGVRKQNAEGLWGSSPSLFAAAVFTELNCNAVFVAAGIEEAEIFHEEARNFVPPGFLRLFPPAEARETDSGSFRGRLRAVSGLVSHPPVLAAAPVQSLLQRLLKSENMSGDFFEARVGGPLEVRRFLSLISDAGYERSNEVRFPGEFALRGGILDIFPVQDELPSRVELDGDRADSIRRFDPEGQLSVEKADSVRIFPVEPGGGAGKNTLFSLLGADSVLFLHNPPAVLRKAEEVGMFEEEILREARGGHFITSGELYKHIDGYRTVNIYPFGASEEDSGLPGGAFRVLAPDSSGRKDRRAEVLSLAEKGFRVFPFCGDETGFSRVEKLLEEFPELKAGVSPVRGWLKTGFLMPDANLALTAPPGRRRAPAQSAGGIPVSDRGELEEGDYVVHINHGVGIYRGLKTLKTGGREGEFLEIEYMDGDRLYIPPSRISLVSKYAGVEGHEPPVSRLGGRSWKKARDRAERSIRDLAGELLELGASRESGEGFGFSPDNDWQREFEDSFAFEETEGQLRALREIKRDMESKKPMDRVVCGDSGYGKTEVALRAAFKCVMDGKQAAVLAPTTVLAQQHFNTFTERLDSFPVNTAVLNRFKNAAAQRRIADGLKSGSIDIVIGTHRLLQKDIAFKDLGLAVIDEEQRFGVAQKEKLKKMRSMVDVLSMSATPIPRTLYMSLVGIRDISMIETAPGMRMPVEGRVVPFSKKLIRLAVLRELERNCQAFYLHNRVGTIENAARMLAELVPEARIGIAHGRMASDELEKVMKDFTDYRIDMLVCTTIIESGLDIQRANTIIIDRADTFGLADLYQLKGRVGRWNRRGSAFFMMPGGGGTPESEKRLNAVHELAGRGSGFNTAMRDLRLRGAGNLLGRQQHGHIAAVGFDLYCRLLRRAAAGLKGEAGFEPETVFDLGSEPCIPEDYVPGLKDRVNIYRRLSSADSIEEVEAVESELRDRFGKLPVSVGLLLKRFFLKVKAGEKGVAYAGVEGGILRIKFRDGREVEENLAPDGGELRALEVIEEKIGV